MISVKDFKDYYESYKADRHPNHSPDLESFGKRVNCMQGALVKNLKLLGLKEKEDFQVSWGMDNDHVVSGFLTSEVLTGATLKAVLDAFSTDEEPRLWLCHFSVENLETLIENEMYIRGNGDVVILKIEGWETVRDQLSA